MRKWLAMRATAMLLCAPLAAPAQESAPNLKGRTIDAYTVYMVGGGYDLYTRLLARHIGAHLPGNPTVVPRNMEGAASLRLANWLYTAVPKDGLNKAYPSPRGVCSGETASCLWKAGGSRDRHGHLRETEIHDIL
jgi:hypothetical protein